MHLSRVRVNFIRTRHVRKFPRACLSASRDRKVTRYGECNVTSAMLWANRTTGCRNTFGRFVRPIRRRRHRRHRLRNSALLKLDEKHAGKYIFPPDSCARHKGLFQHSLQLPRKYCISKPLARTISLAPLSAIDDIRWDACLYKTIKKKKNDLRHLLQRKLSLVARPAIVSRDIILRVSTRGSATVITKDGRLSIRSIVVNAKEDRSYANVGRTSEARKRIADYSRSERYDASLPVLDRNRLFFSIENIEIPSFI